MRSSAKEQMKAIKDRVVVRLSNGLPFSPMGWERDGGDHINVASAGATQLGRALSLRYNRRFMHPLLGSFASVNNIWYFLLAETPSDEMRMINDHARLTSLVKCSGGERRFVENFRAMLIHSVWVMLLNHPDLMRMMAESSLPFDCYRRMSAKALPERFKFTSWFVEGLNEVRLAIKERRRPNLENFLDRKSRAQENPYIYGEAIEWITGVPADEQDRVDFDDYCKTCWANYDKFIAQEATQKASKKPRPEKKKFKVHDIDTPPVAESTPAPVVDVAEVSPEVSELSPDAVTEEIRHYAELISADNGSVDAEPAVITVTTAADEVAGESESSTGNDETDCVVHVDVAEVGAEQTVVIAFNRDDEVAHDDNTVQRAE